MQGFWDNYSTYINLLRIIQFIAMVVLIVIFNKDGMQFNKNKKIEEEINLIQKIIRKECMIIKLLYKVI